MNSTGQIDWLQLKRQLAENEAAWAGIHTVDEVELRNVYRERAERLATRGAVSTCSRQLHRLLVFMLANETYGIPAECVKQVLAFEHCTPLPTASPELLGILSNRGDVLTVIDPRVVLNLPRPVGDERGQVVIVATEADEIGMRVDRLERIQDFDDANLTALTDLSTAGVDGFVRGMTSDRVIVLDPSALCRRDS